MEYLRLSWKQTPPTLPMLVLARDCNAVFPALPLLDCTQVVHLRKLIQADPNAPIPCVEAVKYDYLFGGATDPPVQLAIYPRR